MTEFEKVLAANSHVMQAIRILLASKGREIDKTLSALSKANAQLSLLVAVNMDTALREKEAE